MLSKSNENIVQVFETDIKTEWGKFETLVTTEVEVAYNVVRGVIFGITPTQWQSLVTLLEEIGVDIVDHNYADILQNVLQEAETKGLAFVQTIDEDVLVACIAAYKQWKKV